MSTRSTRGMRRTSDDATRRREGDVLPLTPADPAGLIVRVEDEDKFRAVRGTVGQRVAVQVTGPI